MIAALKKFINDYQQQLANKKWLIILTIMMVATLEVLDSTIVNVALPNMMSSLGANTEEITWVLTSYIVAAAMVMPLTGFLSNRFGTKRLLLTNTLGFMLASFCCGLTDSLTLMVIFRFLQGAFGASLIPLSQSVLRQNFAPEEQGKAMSIWSLGIMLAPTLGPTLGGYITQHSSWRWIFYMNAPFCIMAIFLTLLVIPKGKTQKDSIDWLAMIMMFLGIGALQIFLDQGNSKDWLSSNFILSLLVISIIGLAFFIYRCLNQKKPLINLKIYQDRNFALSSLVFALYCGSIFGLLTIQPIMMETLFGYTSLHTGNILMALGLASGVAMVAGPFLMKRFNAKYILSVALLIASYGAYQLAHISLGANSESFIIADALLGLGMGLFIVPIATYSLATLKSHYVTEGAGLFSYARMLGSSIGISLLSTLLSRETQINWNSMVGNIANNNENLHLWLNQAHMSIHNPTTLKILSNQLYSQANAVAFIDAFYLISMIFLLLIPLVLVMQKVELKNATVAAH